MVHQAPNWKNNVTWGPENTQNVVDCKKAKVAKVMTWMGIVDGQVLPVHMLQIKGHPGISAGLCSMKRCSTSLLLSLETGRSYRKLTIISPE